MIFLGGSLLSSPGFPQGFQVFGLQQFQDSTDTTNQVKHSNIDLVGILGGFQQLGFFAVAGTHQASGSLF